MKKSIISGFFFLLVIALTPVGIEAQEEDAEIQGDAGGGFKIAVPPLGYPRYTEDEDTKRNRLSFAYNRYDTDFLDMYGFSLHINTRIISREWGAFSVKYGGFYADGKELDASWYEDPDTGEWVSEGDFDMTVKGFSLESLFEWQVLNTAGKGEWGYQLVPFFGMETGLQHFDQETWNDPYYSVILGGNGGMQAHMSSPWGGIFSPFFQLAFLRAAVISEDTEVFYVPFISYGFDIIYKNISLSGIVQPFIGDATGIYTFALGFAF